MDNEHSSLASLPVPQGQEAAYMLVALGELKGMVRAVMDKQNNQEEQHRRDVDNITVRLNKHSEEIDALRTAQDHASGAETGKKAVIGLVITAVAMAGGILAWFLANGLNLLQAGAKAGGG